jgi:hypothetical protein
MMSVILLQTASLASIGFLVWLAYVLGFRGGTRISDEAELLALARPYGGAQQYLLGIDGASAIALLNDGQLLAAKTVGDRVTTRIFPTSSLKHIKLHRSKSVQSLEIELRFHDLGFASIRVATTESHLPAWLGQLKIETGKL